MDRYRGQVIREGFQQGWGMADDLQQQKQRQANVERELQMRQEGLNAELADRKVRADQDLRRRSASGRLRQAMAPRPANSDPNSPDPMDDPSLNDALLDADAGTASAFLKHSQDRESNRKKSADVWQRWQMFSEQATPQTRKSMLFLNKNKQPSPLLQELIDTGQVNKIPPEDFHSSVYGGGPSPDEQQERQSIIDSFAIAEDGQGLYQYDFDIAGQLEGKDIQTLRYLQDQRRQREEQAAADAALKAKGKGAGIPENDAMALGDTGIRQVVANRYKPAAAAAEKDDSKKRIEAAKVGYEAADSAYKRMFPTITKGVARSLPPTARERELAAMENPDRTWRNKDSTDDREWLHAKNKVAAWDLIEEKRQAMEAEYAASLEPDEDPENPGTTPGMEPRQDATPEQATPNPSQGEGFGPNPAQGEGLDPRQEFPTDGAGNIDWESWLDAAEAAEIPDDEIRAIMEANGYNQ